MNHHGKQQSGSASGPLFTWRSGGALAAIFALFALTLHLMGRVAWSKSGFGLWTPHAWSSDTSQMFADPYSASHILHGIIFYGILRYLAPRWPLHVRLLAAVLIEVGWEVFENTPFTINRYRTATAALDYSGDSVLNSVGDVLFSILGFWLAARLSWKLVAALAVAMELGMLVTVRDNLTLNIVMFLYPIQAIKQWQTELSL